MEQLVVIGGGGHAKVIIEILQETGEFQLAGCTVSESAERSVLGVPVLGGDSELPGVLAAGVRYAFVAIGSNHLRRRLAAAVQEMGFRLANAVSPRAVVSPSAAVGRGVAVMAGAVINACSTLGDGCIVNTGATVDHDCRLGDWSHIAPGTNLAGNVSIGEGSFLGTGCRVIPGISIGEWTTVGAGATVIHDLPPRVTAVGVPARVLSRPPR
jgi:UDP-perosamine 4-acetyltransferase